MVVTSASTPCGITAPMRTTIAASPRSETSIGRCDPTVGTLDVEGTRMTVVTIPWL
jgi:hypothetical protein